MMADDAISTTPEATVGEGDVADSVDNTDS